MNKWLISIAICLSLCAIILCMVTAVPYQRFIIACQNHQGHCNMGCEAVSFCQFDIKRTIYVYYTVEFYLKNNDVSSNDFLAYVDNFEKNNDCYRINPNIELWRSCNDDIAIICRSGEAFGSVFTQETQWVGFTFDHQIVRMISDNRGESIWDRANWCRMDELELTPGNEQALCKLLNLRYGVDNPMKALIDSCRTECEEHVNNDLKIRAELYEQKEAMRKQQTIVGRQSQKE